MQAFIKNNYHLLIALIVLFAIILLPYVLNWGMFIAGNDSGYFEYGSRFNLERVLFTWRDQNGFGGSSYENGLSWIYLWITKSFYSIFGSIITQIGTKLFFYSCGLIGIYLLLKQYSEWQKIKFNTAVASALAFFYCTNLLGFDLIKTWLHLYYIFYLFTPILLYFAIKFVFTKNKYWLALFTIATIINATIFTNISYPIIQYLLFLSLFIIFFEKKYLRSYIFIFVIFTCINSVSFIEYSLTYHEKIQDYFNNSINTQLINQTPEAQERFFPITNVLSFTSGRLIEGTRWSTGGSVENFQFNDIYTSILFKTISFIPLLIIMSVLWRKDRPKHTPVVFGLFLVSAIAVSMFGFELFQPTLSYLFEKFNTLWVLRNSLKFSPVYLLFGIVLLYIALNKRKKIFNVFVIYLLILNIYSFLGHFSDVRSMTTLPQNYENLDESINKLDKGLGDRMITFPAYQNNWLVYDFGYMGFHPTIVLQNQMARFSNAAYASDTLSNELFRYFSDFKNVTTSDYKKNHIKYGFLNHDINHNAYNLDYSNYVESKEYLDNNFKLILNNSNYSIYEMYDFKTSMIEIPNVEYIKLNPTKYLIKINNLNGSEQLSFLQSFNKSWKMYLMKTDSGSYCPENYSVTHYSENNVTECENKMMPKVTDIALIYRNPIFENTHNPTETKLNSWVLNSEYIKKTYPNEYYQENTDGSVSINIMLYFLPQSYYLLGLSTSLAGILFVIFYLLRPMRYAENV